MICSDKTGTLTTNQMSAVQLCAMGSDTGSLRTWKVTGHTFNPQEGGVEGLQALDKALQVCVRARVCVCVCVRE